MTVKLFRRLSIYLLSYSLLSFSFRLNKSFQALPNTLESNEENEDDSGAFADDELDIDENMLYAISKNTCMLHNSLKYFAAKETNKTHNSLVALEQNKILSQMTKQNILSSQLLLTKIRSVKIRILLKI